MRRLDPAVLHGVAIDPVPLDEVKHEVGAAGGEVDQALAALRPEMCNDGRWIHFGEVRHDEAGVASGRAPGNDLGFKHGNGKSSFGSVKCGREAGETTADDREIDVEPSFERWPVEVIASGGMPEGEGL